MINRAFTFYLFQILLHVIPSLQVDVYYSTNGLECRDLAPGVGCRAPFRPRSHGRYVSDQETIGVTIKNLRATEIAVVWQGRGGNGPGFLPKNAIGDCSGTVAQTLVGPAHSAFFGNMDAGGGPRGYFYTGASYIVMPKTLPPDARTAMFLMAEGMLGLVWGGGSWFSPQAKTVGIPGATRKSRRGRVSGLEGTVYSGPPPRWRYPDSVTLDGTKYESTNTSALDYYSAEGTLLDIAALGV